MRIWRVEFLWLALIAVLFVLAVWWFPTSGQLRTDTYSTSFSGKKALYQTLRQLESGVSRSTDTLIPRMGYEDRLLILGPLRSPTDDEWEALFAEVNYGHSLVYAASSVDRFVEADIFGARVVPLSIGMWTDGEDAVSPPDDGESDGEESDGGTVAETANDHDADEQVSPLFFGKRFAETALTEEEVEWKSQARLELLSDDWEVLVSVKSHPQVARRRIGAGTVVLVASDEIFSNQALINPTRALLAYRILESAPANGHTWLDESLNASGAPKVLGILFDPTFRSITLQLLFIAVLFGWCGSGRFGPAEPPALPRRRSIVEHADALGILYFRAGAGAHAVRARFEYLKQEFRQFHASMISAENAAALSRQTGLDEDQLRALLAELTISPEASLSNTVAGRRLRRLAELSERLRVGSDRRDS